MTDMTLNTDKMYEEWEQHSEGDCPKCGTGDTSLAQEIDRCWNRWDVRSEAQSTDGEEMILIKTACDTCDWTGYLMYELGPFSGYITDEQIQVMTEAMIAKTDARSEAISKGEICWYHEKPDCEAPECLPTGLKDKPVTDAEVFSIINRSFTSVVEDE